MTYTQIAKRQMNICAKYSAPFLSSEPHLKLGLNRDFDISKFPINGLRHSVTSGTSGWFIWSGEWSDEPDFFQAHHTRHVYELYPQIGNYLGLAPGWRFLYAHDYEDIWEDATLTLSKK